MNNTPTPRTDKAEFSFDAFNGVDPWEGERWIKVVPSKISAKLETELTAAREEIKELNDKLDDAVADATNAVNDIIRMKWQRDRLAEALKRLENCDWVITPHDR